MITRKPTGRPSWPIVLLAGREKAGKSWAAISASASPLIGRTLYIGIGEDDPDEYSLIPGADFDIVVHDGTYQGIVTAVREAVLEPAGELPTLLVIDSATRLWNLISDNMQAIANQRAKGRRNPNGDFTISTDLWNVAAGQWGDVMDALRLHAGPVIVTARLDPVVVMENGQPTAAKEWKVQAHKTLPFDATAVVEMRERGKFLLTGVRSARVLLEKPRDFPKFTVEALWDAMGLSDGVGERSHATVHTDEAAPPPRQRTQMEIVADAVAAIGKAATTEELNNLEKLAGQRRITGQKQVVDALSAKRAELGPSGIDPWAPNTPTGGEDANPSAVPPPVESTWPVAEVKP